MKYLNFEKLDSLDAEAFLGHSPFPLANPQGALTEEGFARLMKTMPGPQDPVPSQCGAITREVLHGRSL